MICNICLSKQMEDEDLLHHLINNHKYALPALKYVDIALKACKDWEPEFNSEQPCFFQTISMGIPSKFPHPQDVVETFPKSKHKFLLEYGMPFNYLPAFCKDNDVHIVMHIMGDKATYTGYVDIGNKEIQPIYMRYNYGVHYNLILIEEAIQVGQLEDMISNVTFNINSLIDHTNQLEYKQNQLDVEAFSGKLTTHLNDILGNIEALKTLPRDFMITLTTSIVSSIISIATSLITLITNEVNKPTVALNIISIITNLTSFAWSVYGVCKYWKISFDVNNVIQGLPALVNSFMEVSGEKKANSVDFIVPAITTVVSLLLSGIVAFTPLTIKNVVSGGSMIKATKEYGTTAESVVKFITDDLCDLNMFGNKHHYDAIVSIAKEGTTLVTTPTYKFFQDPTLITKLRTFPHRVIDLTTKKIPDKELSHAITSAKILLNQTLTSVYEKITAIDAVVENKNRQECFAIYLSGSPGAGKSKLCMYMAQKIAQIMGYNPRVFNLQREGQFSLPYGGEVFGIFNEFMNLRSENDDLLPRFNGVVSGDPYNFESAHLGGKVQPCMIKLLFLTSNIEAPPLTRTLVDSAASAVWSRCMRFTVEDPKFQGRMGINAHRKEDFSHLLVHRVVNNDCIGTNLEKERVTIDTMIGAAIHQLAKRELNFFKNHECQLPLERTLRLENIVGKVEHLNSNTRPGQSFFVIRIQGDLDTGKSTLSGDISSMFDNLLPRHKIYWLKSPDDFTKIIPIEPGIYCIDDIMYREQQMAYFNWINQGTADNIYILVTTEIMERRSTSMLNTFASYLAPDVYPKTYIVDTVAPEGYGRRIGLEGLVRIKTATRTHDTYNPPHLCATITTHRGFRISHEGTDLNISQLKDLLYSRYVSYIKTTNLIVLVSEPYRGSSDHTVEIETPNYKTLLEALANPVKLYKAYSSDYERTTVRVANSFAQVMFGRTFVKDWIVPEQIETEADFLSLAMRMTASLRRADPNATCRILIHDIDKELIYANNTIHWDCQLLQAENFMVTHDGLIACRFRNKEVIISPEEYASLSIIGNISDNIAQIPYGILSGLHPFYNKIAKNIKLKYELSRMQMGHRKSAKALTTGTILSALKHNKIVLISAGLLTLAGVSGIGYTIYKMFTENTTGGYKSNSSDDEEGEFGKFTQRMRKHVMSGNKQDVQTVRDEAKTAGYGERLARWEFEWRSNALKTIQLPPPTAELLHQLINSDPHHQLEDYMLQYPKETAGLLCKRTNGLSPFEENFQKPTCMDNFAAKLNKMYFQIIAPAGMNYAISLGEGLVLSVSHIVNKCGDLGQISSMGNHYPISCVAISTDRDLSIWRILSKDKPPTPHIKKYLTSMENFENISRAWFVRPSAVRTVCAQANVTFIEHLAQRRYDSTNYRYSPHNNLWDFSLIDLHNVGTIIRDGDCGLPLVAMINNEPKVIGIHNAYSKTGDATYSGISIEDIDIFMRETLPVKANSLTEKDFLIHELEKTGQHFTTVPELREAVLSEWQPSKFEKVSKLEVYGFCPKLNIYSNPAHKKRFIPIVGTTLKCESLPSALTYDPKYIRDESSLIKDKHGKPHTLFTQCVKYANRTETYQLWDQEILDHAVSLVKMRIGMDYGEFAPLNTKEVLNGLSKLQPFDLTTSAGPYFKIFHNVTNKEKLLFNKSPEGSKPYYDWQDTLYGEKLQMQYRRYVDSISSGVPVFVLSKDNAKVELLPRDKVYVGKVRLFNELDFAVNMMLKKFFGRALNSIMEKSTEKPYAIGSNAYTLGTSIQREFTTISGNVISTDYSSMDKSMCPEVITKFCETFLSYLPKSSQQAMANTLIYTLHTMDGHLYSVNNGNESGSFVTTMLNCYCVELILFYTMVNDFKKEHERLPSLKEILSVVKYRIMGDDMTAKFAIDINLEHMVECASVFNMKLTPAKVISNNPSFCSREIIPSNIHPHVWFSRLKKSSITACLFYFAEVTPIQIAANINVALFEASMWDEEYFNEVQRATNILIIKYRCERYYEGYTYKQYRQQICQYILGCSVTPTLLAVGSQISQINDYKSNTLLISEQIANIMDPVSILNEYIQKHGLKPLAWDETNVGTPNSPIWETNLKVYDVCQTISGKAIEPGKKSIARHVAASQCVSKLLLKTCNAGDNVYYTVKGAIHDFFDSRGEITTEVENGNIQSFRTQEGDYVAEYIQEDVIKYQSLQPTRVQAVRKIMKLVENPMNTDFIYECMKIQVNLAKTLAEELKIGAVWLYVDPSAVEISDADKAVCKGIHYHYLKSEKGEKYLVISKTSQQFKYSQVSAYYELFGAILHNEGIYLDTTKKSNAGNPMVEPSSIQQTAVNSQAGTLPPPTNPQPSGVVPALAPAGENAISAIEGIQTQVLNPIGAPNMTGVGAVMFDIKTLIYSQFMDSDVEIQLTDDAPSGSILLQIPYDPLGVHVNKYIRAYVEQHERYTGALQFRFTVVGNPLFSGYIGISWQPRKITTPTMDISEFQKFSYDSKGVTLPWSEVHILHDARKEYFYRETTDTDIDNRPHLVVALIVSIQNPLREGVITRIRVASKLSSIGEPNPFFVTLPTIVSPSSALRTANNHGSNQVDFLDMFPQALTERLWIYTDGFYSLPDMRNNRSSLKMLFHHAQGSGFGQNNQNVTRTLGYSDNTIFNTFNTLGGPLVFPSGKENAKFAIYVTTNCDTNHAYTIADTLKTGALSVQSVWTNLYTTATWSLSRNQFSNSTYDSTTIVMTTGLTNIVQVCGAVKVITRRGMAVFTLVGHFDSVPANLTPDIFYLPSAIVDGDNSISPQPYANIDNALIASNASIERLPLGYQALRISEMPPSSITIAGMMLPTANNEQTVLSVFRNRARGLPLTQVLQFLLTDNVSVRSIATVRFLQETDEFVINVPTDSAQYRVLGVSNSNISITNISIVNRTNDFPLTSLTSWINRTAPDFTRRSDVFRSIGMPITEVKSNGAMMGMQMAGGALGGLGQAMGQASQNKFQESMQSNQFGHEASMQGNMFGQQTKTQGLQNLHENKLQDQSHMFQQAMQEAGFNQSNYQMGETFGQQNKMQQQQFGHDIDVSNLQHANMMTQQAAQSRNRMTERGVSSSIFSAPGAGTIAMRA